MQRRHFISVLMSGVCAGVAVDALAHTPYNQWRVYRRKHLLIGCHKDAEETYTLAKQIVGVLDEHLPKASARVARAPTAQRIASLMATDQMDVAVLQPIRAYDMSLGQNEFAPYGEIALSSLVQINDLSVVCRSDIPEHHAWLVTDALLESFTAPLGDEQALLLPFHQGAQLRHDGKSLP